MGEEHIPKNGGKNPAFQFYPNDWSRDLEEHPLEVEGAWIRLICKLWYSPTKGTMTRTLDQWSRIMRESTERTRELLEYIGQEGIGDITFIPENSNGESNAEVTVQCRRMVRDEVIREQNRARQAEYRKRQAQKQME